MAKPFDATTKRLLELDPVGWLRCAGLPVTGPVRAVDSDLSTVTAEADTIIQVGEPVDYLAHIEIQFGHDLTMPRRLLHYNVLLNYRYDRPVRSVLILLRREADSPSFSGHHQVLQPDGSSYLDFRYSVLRIWTMDVETILQSGLGALPLAPIADVRDENQLRTVISRMRDRFDEELAVSESSLLWTATKILMGMKYSSELVASLLQGVQRMKESVTYQEIVEEGVVKGEARGVIKGEQRFLIRMGQKQLGEPPAEIQKRIEAIDDEAILWSLADRMFEASSWDELLANL